MITPGVTTSGRLRRVLIGRGGVGTVGFSVVGCELSSRYRSTRYSGSSPR